MDENYGNNNTKKTSKLLLPPIFFDNNGNNERQFCNNNDIGFLEQLFILLEKKDVNQMVPPKILGN